MATQYQFPCLGETETHNFEARYSSNSEGGVLLYEICIDCGAVLIPCMNAENEVVGLQLCLPGNPMMPGSKAKIKKMKVMEPASSPTPTPTKRGLIKT